MIDQAFLESAGVDFVAENGGGAGVGVLPADPSDKSAFMPTCYKKGGLAPYRKGPVPMTPTWTGVWCSIREVV